MHVQYTQRRPLNAWQKILFGSIFLIIGVSLLAFSYFHIQDYQRKSQTYVSTTAYVVDYQENSSDDLVAIIVEYVVDGQTYRKTSNVYSNTPRSIGTHLSIKYDPNNPKNMIWGTDSTNIILPAVGVMFILGGIIIIVSGVKGISRESNTEYDYNTSPTISN